MYESDEAPDAPAALLPPASAIVDELALRDCVASSGELHSGGFAKLQK